MCFVMMTNVRDCTDHTSNISYYYYGYDSCTVQYSTVQLYSKGYKTRD